MVTVGKSLDHCPQSTQYLIWEDVSEFRKESGWYLTVSFGEYNDDIGPIFFCPWCGDKLLTEAPKC